MRKTMILLLGLFMSQGLKAVDPSVVLRIRVYTYGSRGVLPENAQIVLLDSGEVRAKVVNPTSVKFDAIIDTFSASQLDAFKTAALSVSSSPYSTESIPCAGSEEGVYILESTNGTRYPSGFSSGYISGGKACGTVGKRNGTEFEILNKVLWMYKNHLDVCLKAGCSALNPIP